MDDPRTRVLELARGLEPRLVEMRRALHRHPEVAGQERWSTGQIRQWLEAAGIAVLPLNLETGLAAEVRGGAAGPLVAIRADIDALPVQEETGLSFASLCPGVMHACGHDFHAAVALGAALVLQDLAPGMAGRVRILFQPEEETAGGAVKLIRAGALEGVQAVFGLHNKPDLPAGHVGIKPGPLMAATDSLTITISGKGGHAAIPHATVDPVVAGSAIVMALQTAVSRAISPLESAVLSISSFQAGSAHNVIPPSARLLGTLRTFDPAVRSHMQDVVRRIVTSVAAGYGATAVLTMDAGTPAVNNHPDMAAVMERAAQALGLPVVAAIPTMGGEDFAQYQQVVPGCFVWLGTGCMEEWHHPRFMVDEAVLWQGAALLAQAALEAMAR